MIVYFQEPYDTNENALNKIVSNFKYLNIRQLYSSAEVYYDVGTNDSKKSNSRKLKNDKVSMPFFVNNQKVEINTLPFVFRIKINIEKDTELFDRYTSYFGSVMSVPTFWSIQNEELIDSHTGIATEEKILSMYA